MCFFLLIFGLDMANVAEMMEKSKIFILLSTVLTWAKSRQPDPDDKEVPFTEEDYRRRKPHPKYMKHFEAEKSLVKAAKKAKKSLSTYVVAAGLTYGLGENIFHQWFKNGWHNYSELTIIDEGQAGQNVLPMIHIIDLAAALQNLIDTKPKTRYIIGTDGSKNTQEEIVKAISGQLSTGKAKRVPLEDVVQSGLYEEEELDLLTCDLRMEPSTVREAMNINWKCDNGLVETIGQIVKEFKEHRKLMVS